MKPIVWFVIFFVNIVIFIIGVWVGEWYVSSSIPHGVVYKANGETYLNENTDNIKEASVDSTQWKIGKLKSLQWYDCFGKYVELTLTEQIEWKQLQAIEDWKRENSWLFKEYAPEDTLKIILMSSGDYDLPFPTVTNDQMYHALERIAALEESQLQLQRSYDSLAKKVMQARTKKPGI